MTGFRQCELSLRALVPVIARSGACGAAGATEGATTKQSPDSGRQIQDLAELTQDVVCLERLGDERFCAGDEELRLELG